MRTAIKRYKNFQLQPYISAGEIRYQELSPDNIKLQPYISAGIARELDLKHDDLLQPYISAGWERKRVCFSDVT